jgi:molecular chaperone GrpE
MQDKPEITVADQNPPEQRENPANAAPGSESPRPAMEVTPSLEQQLRQAELAAQEHHDAWLRAKAEADNIRKRAQSEIASAHRFAVENFATELLAVKDSLEAALATDNAAAEQLNSVFGKFSLSEINPAGEKFDPHRHQAISAIESGDAEPNTVLQVLQKGYLLHERVIRPALVTVAKQQEKAVES